jgi:hypothetical protein
MKETATLNRNVRRLAQSLAAAVSITILLATAAQAASSRETGRMADGRDGHLAFLLTDGRVLVVGGLNAARESSLTTEIYDPASGRWSVSGSVKIPRNFSAGVVLADGRVFVVGGAQSGKPKQNTRIAEIYDPATGLWMKGGKMKRSRYNPTATLLSDGRVIVAGGETKSANHQQTYEIFDPATGRFSAPTLMPKAFQFHSATRLDDGRVLFVGSLVRDGTGSEALLYDPASNTWTATGSREARGDHGAAFLALSGEVLAFSGTICEIYNPGTGAWLRTGDLPFPRAAFAVAVTGDGLVLRVSGNENPPGGTPTPKVDIFSPATGTWSDGGTILRSRFGCTATQLLDGTVLVAGGRDSSTNESLSSAEIYTP